MDYDDDRDAAEEEFVRLSKENEELRAALKLERASSWQYRVSLRQLAEASAKALAGEAQNAGDMPF